MAREYGERDLETLKIDRQNLGRGSGEKGM
jgi:hypothetical protein